MTNKEIRKTLQNHFCDEPGCVSYYKGVWTVREGYFYRHGRSEDKVALRVLGIFPEAKIVDKGDHWATFNGGASIKASSHFWVKFTV